MNEELKEAILELNRYTYGKQLSKDDIVEYTCILINSINKQQKEIEDLKFKYQARKDRTKNNMISKDIIREKIKELEEMELSKGDIFFKMRNFAIVILRELLEE